MSGEIIDLRELFELIRQLNLEVWGETKAPEPTEQES